MMASSFFHPPNAKPQRTDKEIERWLTEIPQPKTTTSRDSDELTEDTDRSMRPRANQDHGHRKKGQDSTLQVSSVVLPPAPKYLNEAFQIYGNSAENSQGIGERHTPRTGQEKQVSAINDKGELDQVEEDRSSVDISSSQKSDEETRQGGILFLCTFCPKKYSTLADWRRHELEKHIQSPIWECQPSSRSVEGLLVCFFCDGEIAKGLCSHNVIDCGAEQGRSRRFRGKHQLKKHLMQDHNLDARLSERAIPCFKLDSVVDVSGIDLTCYYCGYIACSWRDRADHVGNHYRLHPCSKTGWDNQKEITLNLRARDQAQNRKWDT